jgi:hypothetical protein
MHPLPITPVGSAHPGMSRDPLLPPLVYRFSPLSSRADMTPEQVVHDHVARQQVSRELGHERLSIVGLYIGTK